MRHEAQCSIWPAFWTHAVSWPSGGEIDIFEGVNLQPQNQVALHSVAGCEASPTSETSPNGVLQSTNCDYTQNANQGCTFTDTRNASYGAGFAQNGGGIYAAELSSDAISVWFFPVGSKVFFSAVFPLSLTRSRSSLVALSNSQRPPRLLLSTRSVILGSAYRVLPSVELQHQPILCRSTTHDQHRSLRRL